MIFLYFVLPKLLSMCEDCTSKDYKIANVSHMMSKILTSIFDAEAQAT